MLGLLRDAPTQSMLRLFYVPHGHFKDPYTGHCSSGSDGKQCFSKGAQLFNWKLQWDLLKKPFNISRNLAFAVASVQELTNEFP